MSWDVLLLRLPLSTTALSDLPISYVPPPFGTRARVAEDLMRAVTGIEWVTPEFGVLRTEQFVIEIDLGKSDRVDRVLLHVRGANNALESLRSMMTALGGKAVDCETDLVLDLEDEAASSGLQSWREQQAAEVASDRESQRLMDAGAAGVFTMRTGPKSPRN